MDRALAMPVVASSFDQAQSERLIEMLSLDIAEIAGETAMAPHVFEAPLRAEEVSRMLLASAADAIYAIDAEGLITFINSLACTLTGWAPDELLHKPHRGVAPLLPFAAAPGLPLRGGACVFRRKDGTSFPGACTANPILRHGRLVGTVVVFRDLSEVRRKVEWEQNKRKILAAIIGQHSLPLTMRLIAEALVALCPDKALAVFLRAGEQFELVAAAGLPQPVLNRLCCPPSAPVGGQSQPRVRPARSASPDALARSCPAFREILDSGAKLCMASQLIAGSGEVTGAVAVFDHRQGLLDDTAGEAIQSACDLARLAVEHRQLHDEVIHLAQYDLLTGLPNRFLLEDRLRQSMVHARRQGSLIAVCCIDLEGFKQINDSLGHELGDTCLKTVSRRLQASVREIDTLGYRSGDEFFLVLRDLAQTSSAANICSRLLKELTAPLPVEGHAVAITACIGISIFPDHGDTVDRLVGNADIAVQAARRVGRGHVQVYSKALGRATRRGAEMEEALAAAVAQGQLSLVYQPIYTSDRRIAGLEALLRWKHPAWGQIRPTVFIPIAERTGLIVPIGDWVIAEVCRQAMEWDAANLPPVKMFLNVSGAQLARPNFCSKIAETLERSGLAPDRLEIEITESWIISDLRGVAGKLQKLRTLGISVAIDDFGTGRANFTYLDALPLDTVKIDRSFIHRLDGSAPNVSTLRAITSLAQQLGLKTVAEGVETEQQRIQLGEIGCDFLQGFLLSRPLKPQAACSLLKKHPHSGSPLRKNVEPMTQCLIS